MELHNVFASCFVLEFLKELNYTVNILSEEWGNRVEILAIFNDTSKKGVLDKTTIEELSESYTSYKAKLYQENLESYVRKIEDAYKISQNQLILSQSQTLQSDTQQKLTHTESQLVDTKEQLAHSESQLQDTQQKLTITETQLLETLTNLHKIKKFPPIRLLLWIRRKLFV